MKNIKTNTMLLSLGLLVSGSVMHAAKTYQQPATTQLKQTNTQEKSAIIDKIHKAFNDIKLNKPLTNDWTKVTAQAIAFIKTGANTRPKSKTLTMAAEAAEHFLIEVNRRENKPNVYLHVGDPMAQLKKAAELCEKTTYHRSEKQAAYAVFLELIPLLEKVGNQLLQIRPSSAAAVPTAREKPKFNPREGAPAFKPWGIPTQN